MRSWPSCPYSSDMPDRMSTAQTRLTVPDESCLPSVVAARYQYALSALRVAKRSGKQGKILIEGFPANLIRASPLIRSAIREQFAAGEMNVVLAVETSAGNQDQADENVPMLEEEHTRVFPPAWEETWARDPAEDESDEDEEGWAAELKTELENPVVRRSLKAVQAQFRQIRVSAAVEAEE